MPSLLYFPRLTLLDEVLQSSVHRSQDKMIQKSLKKVEKEGKEEEEKEEEKRKKERERGQNRILSTQVYISFLFLKGENMY